MDVRLGCITLLGNVSSAMLQLRNVQTAFLRTTRIKCWTSKLVPSVRLSSGFQGCLKTRSLAEDVDSQEIQNEEYGSGAHVPVMLNEVLQVFDGRRISNFVDCTLGAGGHASAMIRSHSEMRRFVGLDEDPLAHKHAQAKLQAALNENSCALSSELKLYLVCNNFKYLTSVLGNIDKSFLIEGVDGILMDLGMSSMQVDNAERGFSILYDGPLDMRMSPTKSLKAEDIVNHWPERELGRILRDYGEEKRWRLLQRKIAEARLCGGIHSTLELVELIRKSIFNISGRKGWIKTAIRVFQALRIAVNDELKTLEVALNDAFLCLASKGRLAVISFHSLEDRIVKQSFLNIINKDIDDNPERTKPLDFASDFTYVKQDDNASDFYSSDQAWICRKIEGKYGRILTKNPIRPSKEEESRNRRCRSAKLRVLEKY